MSSLPRFVNGMMAERPGFSWILKNGTKEEAFDELSNILEEFYKQKYNKYLAESR